MDVVADAASSLDPGLSSLRAAYYGRPFSFVNNLFEELEALREVVAASPGRNQVPAKENPLRVQRGF